MNTTLAVKYRPATFESMVEQSSIKTILENQLRDNNIKSSYLFVGPAGTGKTTVARIMADKINGRENSAEELDAASNNSVDDVRKIINSASYSSLTSKYRVFIIDECHMLTPEAWNAFLKTLEEPPQKVVFIFCTTDPRKIPNTILSRVQRFDFKRISSSGILSKLKEICDTEINSEKNVTSYSVDALSYISRIANGGMRDAITDLEKCADLSSDITMETASKALDFIDLNYMCIIVDYIYNSKAADFIDLTEKLYFQGVDFKAFAHQLLDFSLNILKYALTNDINQTNLSSSVVSWIDENSKTMEFYNALLTKCIDLNQTIKWEQNPKVLFQSTLIEFMIGA